MNRDDRKFRRPILLFIETVNPIMHVLGQLVALQYAFLYKK